MKKLFALLLLALPTALFGQIQFSTWSMLGGNTDISVPDYLLASTMNDISITGSYSDGTLMGSNTYNQAGLGVSAGPAGISISGSSFTYGVAYSLSIKDIGGLSVMSLNYAYNNMLEASETNVINISFEDLGIDPGTAAAALENPATSDAAMAMLNNASGDFMEQCMADYDQDGGSNGSDPGSSGGGDGSAGGDGSGGDSGGGGGNGYGNSNGETNYAGCISY